MLPLPFSLGDQTSTFYLLPPSRYTLTNGRWEWGVPSAASGSEGEISAEF